MRSKDRSYERLIGPIETRMMRSIWRIVRDPQEAEDALQEALTVIWRRLSRICRHPNPQALILKICIDAAYDSLRRWNRHHRFFDREVARQLGDHADSSAEHPVEGIVRRETEAEVLQAIARLPRKQAVAALMRIVQDQPYDQIARALGCREATVRIHVSRARTRLSRWLAHLNPRSSTEVLP